LLLHKNSLTLLKSGDENIFIAIFSPQRRHTPRTTFYSTCYVSGIPEYPIAECLERNLKVNARKEERPPVTPIRTASEMDARIVIPPLMQVPIYPDFHFLLINGSQDCPNLRFASFDKNWAYREIAQKVAELRRLNMAYTAIAKSLNVSKQLVIIAFRYYQDQR
jgi:hypothetical protein